MRWTLLGIQPFPCLNINGSIAARALRQAQVASVAEVHGAQAQLAEAHRSHSESLTKLTNKVHSVLNLLVLSSSNLFVERHAQQHYHALGNGEEDARGAND